MAAAPFHFECLVGAVHDYMKRSLLAFRWFLASLVLGMVAFGILIVSGVYLSPHTEVTTAALSRRALLTGLTIWIFLVGVPLMALILGIRRFGAQQSPNRSKKVGYG